MGCLPQRGLLGKGPWLSLRQHFIGLMTQNQVSGRKTKIWSVVLPAQLSQCRTSTAGQCNASQWWWPWHAQTHSCAPGGGYPASCKMWRERGLEGGSMCGFFLHLFTTLISSYSYTEWLDRSSLCTWLHHWSAGRFRLWFQWHLEVGSCAHQRDEQANPLSFLYGWRYVTGIWFS